jgi:hypothetical protein
MSLAIEPGMAPPVLIFGHIHKTAGSTLKTILWRQYSPQSVFFSMTPEEHGVRFEALRSRMETEQRPVEVVVTHGGYGVHTLLPSRYTYSYFTFLREPIDRVMSGYYMFLRQGKIPSDLTIDRFVQTYLRPGCNMQTAYLSGYLLECFLQDRLPEREAFTEALLQKAKDNLARHAVVGLTERFDESLLLLQQAYGWHWRNLLYARENVGHNRKPREVLSDASRRVVVQYNELDLELYRYARQLFAEQVQVLGDVERRVARFRTMNRVYAATVPRVMGWMRPVVRAVRGQ